MDDIDALIDGIGNDKPKAKGLGPIDAAIDSVADASDNALKTNILAGSKSNPEQVARAKALQKVFGAPVDFIERNLEDVEQKVKRRTVEGKITKASTLRERATADREFTKLIMDDEALPDVETALRTQGFKAASIQRRKAQDREIKDRWDRLLGTKQSRSFTDVISDPLKAAAAGSNIMAAGMAEFARYNPVDIAFNKALSVFAPELKAEFDDTKNQVQDQFNSGVEFWNQKKSFDIQDRIERFNQAGIGEAIGMLATDPGLLLDQLAQSSPYLIPGAAAARGGTGAMLGYTSIIEAMDAANTARQEAVAAGATPEQQNSAAAIAALVTAPIAFLGNKLTGAAKIETDFLTKGTVSNTMLSAMVREAISGAAEEGGNQFGVNLGAILGYDDDRESTEGVGKATAIGGFLEAVQGGGMRAISLANQKINGEIELSQDIMADAEAIQAAVDKVSETKLLQRDEPSLRGYMQQVANDMGVETVDGETKVYLSAEALSQIANEIPNIEQDLQTAQEAGHDVAVNLGDLVVAMSKTGTAQEIIPAIRFAAGQPTVAEAQINAQPELQRMMEEAQKIAVQEQENTKFEQESREVYDDVLEQLQVANRFSREVNAPYAKLHQAFYQTYAHRMGMSVGDFYDQYGMKIADTTEGGLEQAVYHGSPYKFDKFTLDHIGSGEGAQAYGWGLYFAGDKQIAEFYRNALKPPVEITDWSFGATRIKKNGDYLDYSPRDQTPQQQAKATLSEDLLIYENDIKDAFEADGIDGARNVMLRIVDDRINSAKEEWPEIVPHLKVSRIRIETELVFRAIKDEGQLYEVDIPNDGEYLIWDKPLSDQPDNIRKALEQAGFQDNKAAVGEFDDALLAALQTEQVVGIPKQPADPSGEKIYEKLIGLKGSDEAASKYLHSLGIQGIQYLDGSSRGSGEGNYNYVVFDDSAIKILDTYYQKDTAPRGTYNPETRTIALLNASDLSTFLHESSHGFLEILTELASLPDAPADILADTQKVMDWFGTDLASWNTMTLDQRRDYHEKWAEASERYFFEGKAPTLELQGIFQKFRDWIKSVYKTLQDLIRMRPGAVDLTDEIRQVMDRLYATDEAIAAAQETRGLLPLFVTQEESGLNDDDWREYQANAQAATQDAIDEMNVRSLRDMKWMRRARDGYIKNLQKDAEELRRETTMEARRNVLSEPVYQAWTFLTAREWGKVSKAKASKSLDPSKDSLMTAIAKLGGVDSTEADKDFGFDHSDMKVKPVFGKPVFRKSGGKSFDAMTQLLADYGYLTVDENNRADVRDLEDYLFDEIRGNPHYSYAYKSEESDRQSEVNLTLQLPAGRLNPDTVKAMLGDRWDEVSPKLRGMVASDGIHPDVVAEQYRNPEGGEAFLSGADMVEKLIQAVPPSQAIQAETDRLMLERYGDINSSEALEAAADEALHNEAMLRMSATELKALLKINTPVRQLEKAARDSAIQVLARTPVKELNPNKYASAAARAARLADKAIAKRDIDTAAAQKRIHALNLALTKEAYAAKSEVTKALADMRKLRRSDKDMAKTHDINMIDAARSIANAFGINGAMANPAEALASLEKVKHYNPEIYDQLLPVVQSAAFNAKSYRELSLEDFRGLASTVKQLMHQARRSKQITVDGRKVDILSAREALVERMEEIGIKAESPGERQAVSDRERSWWTLSGMKNATRRMESWVDTQDAGDFNGPFRTYLYNSVRDGVDKYRTEKNRVLRKYIAEVQKMDFLGQFKADKIAAPELGYSFGSENGNGKQELLGAMLHIGNDSNKRKLLLGRGWGKLVENPDGTRTLDSTQWDNFIRRMFAEGQITKEDMDFLQFTWDLMDSIKPAAQQAHFELYGYYFDEITADPIQTPFGEYKGGYAPAKADADLVQDAAIRQGANEIENDFNYMMPSTGNGFTKGRVEYNRPLVMDLRLVGQHIDQVLRFTYIQPAVNDVLKLVKDREVSETLRRFDQASMDALIMPWLQRTAQQIRTTPFAGRYDGKALQKFFTGLRRRTGMSIMMANLVNALQQTTGLSLAAVKVKPRYIKASLAKWTSSPNAMSNAVAELSPWMRERLDSDIFEMQQAMDNILLGANQYDKFKDFVTRNAYFMQRAFQNSVDLIAWQAAFEEAQEGGMDVDQAVKRADFIVRETQSSLNPEDISKFETGNAFVQLFTQFYNYFNMQANFLGSEYAKTMREQGIRKGSGRLLYLYVFGFAIPATMADAIVRTFGWDWDDDDDDGYLDEFYAWFFGSQFRTATAMIPGVGPTINAFVNRFNDLPYDDRISTSPAVSMIEQAAGAPITTYKAVFDDGSWKRAIRDNLTLLSLTTGMPVLPLAKPLGYVADMQQGNVEPANGLDLARGLVSGKGREEERAR